jgi:hypothetical protein
MRGAVDSSTSRGGIQKAEACARNPLRIRATICELMTIYAPKFNQIVLLTFAHSVSSLARSVRRVACAVDCKSVAPLSCCFP